jgi:hypothetical protein
MATSGANTVTSATELDCPLWTQGAPCHGHGIDALAMGGYFGGYIGTPTHQAQVHAWTTDPDGGFQKLFQELAQGGVLTGGPAGGAVPATLSGAGAQLATANARGLTLLAYEGGQALYGSGGVENDSAITNLFTLANRDARMGAIYDQFFAGWKAAGAHLFNHFQQRQSVHEHGELGLAGVHGSERFAEVRRAHGVHRGQSVLVGQLRARDPRRRGSGDAPGETPLTVAKAGSDITLSWQNSCLATDVDASIYEGVLGLPASHAPIVCSTGGSTAFSLTPGAGGRYYLVVPNNGDYEGSYGKDGSHLERPAAAASCRAQSLGACPWVSLPSLSPRHVAYRPEHFVS